MNGDGSRRGKVRWASRALLFGLLISSGARADTHLPDGGVSHSVKGVPTLDLQTGRGEFMAWGAELSVEDGNSPGVSPLTLRWSTPFAASGVNWTVSRESGAVIARGAAPAKQPFKVNAPQLFSIPNYFLSVPPPAAGKRTTFIIRVTAFDAKNQPVGGPSSGVVIVQEKAPTPGVTFTAPGPVPKFKLVSFTSPDDNNKAGRLVLDLVNDNAKTVPSAVYTITDENHLVQGDSAKVDAIAPKKKKRVTFSLAMQLPTLSPGVHQTHDEMIKWYEGMRDQGVRLRMTVVIGGVDTGEKTIVFAGHGDWPSASSCVTLKATLADLDRQLATAMKVSKKDPSNVNALHKVSGLVKKIQTAAEKEAVHCSSRTPDATSVVAPTATGIPDPQLAVGDKYVLSISTGNLAFYQRVGNGLAAAPIKISTNKLFEPIQKKLNQHVVTLDPRFKASCDPENPTQVPHDANNHLTGPPSCISTFYDARATYDMARKRFWIIAASRHILYRCKGGKPGALTHIKSLQQLTNYTVDFGDKPGMPKDNECQKDWDGLAKRFVSVAVSKSEDPNDGFHTYVTSDDYADWPQFVLHDDYLLVNHTDMAWGTLKQFVYNAKDMANGTSETLLMGKELLTLDKKQLTALSPDLPPELPLTPITIHGDSDGVLYLVGGSQGRLLVYGLASPKGHPTSKPEILDVAAVTPERPFDGARNNGVFSAGRIHLTGHECVKTRDGSCVAYGVRVLRFPVSRQGQRVRAQNEGDWTIDRSLNGLSLEMPTLEVNDDRDMVVVYERQAVDPAATFQPTSIAYNVFYNRLTGPSDSAVLKQATTTAIPCVDGQNMPHPGDSDVDLGGAALDPRGGEGHRKTVWISHAYVEDAGMNITPPSGCKSGPQGRYAGALGAVTP